MNYFTKATEVDPTYPQAWLLIARVHLDHGKAEEALEAAQRAVSIDLEFAEAHLCLGRANVLLGDMPQAVIHLANARRYGSSDPSWQRALEELEVAIGK